MVKTKVKEELVNRNIRLTGEIIKYILGNPDMLDLLPDKFELVLLPENDPELRQLNLDLLDKYGSEGKPNVFARINAGAKQIKPSIFTPVAVWFNF